MMPDTERMPGGQQEFDVQRERYHNRTIDYMGPVDMFFSWWIAHSLAKELKMDVIPEHARGFDGGYRIVKRDER
ncbi:MAG TPA: hypothetical protein VJH90_00575 [archaeon]|nr:hypothetical protein [archaeon]